MATSYLGYQNVVGMLQPVTAVSATFSTAWVHMDTGHEIAFLAQFGAVTGTSAIDALTITVEASTTNDSTTATAVAFKYRLSSAVTANTWGAITDAASTGYAPVVGTITGKNLLISIDPAQVQATVDSAQWVKMEVVCSASVTAYSCAVVALVNPRYKQTTMVSAT